MRFFSREQFRASRWRATRAAARLGIIAATLSGIALALHLGGRDGYTLPLTALLGAPTDVLLLGTLARAFHWTGSIISSAGPHSEWIIRHLVFCGSIAINWTLIGFAADLARGRPTPKVPDRENTPEELPAPDPLREAFEEMERQVRERRTPELLDPAQRAA